MAAEGAAGLGGRTIGEGDAVHVDVVRAGLRSIGRMTRTNSAAATGALLSTVGSVLRNVAENPGEAKFRQLRVRNKAVQSKILAGNGGLQLLRLVGFRRCMRDDEEIFHLAGDSRWLPHLGLVREWVESTKAELSEPGSAAHGGGGAGGEHKTAASAILQVKMIDGSNVTAGFEEQEPLEAVVSFVRDYARCAAAAGAPPVRDIVLGTAYPKVEFTGDDRSKSLRSLGLVRASVVVSHSVRSGAPSEFRDRADLEAKRLAKLAEEEERVRAKAEAIAAKRAAERAAAKEERTKALAAFHDDRVGVAVREEISHATGKPRRANGGT